MSHFIPNTDAQTCYLCKKDSFFTFKCKDCDNKSHLLCALKDSNISIFDFFTKNEFYCTDHFANHEKYCFCNRSYVEGELFMIACDVCDIWYHGDCVKVSPSLGENIEHYLCKLCHV